jgi:hypothetical protein
MNNKSYEKWRDGAITKEEPFVVTGNSRRDRRLRERKLGNSKGAHIIVARIGTSKQGHALFWKFKKTIQREENRVIVHFKTI